MEFALSRARAGTVTKVKKAWVAGKKESPFAVVNIKAEVAATSASYTAIVVAWAPAIAIDTCPCYYCFHCTV